jgi:hypothetical protein
MKEKETKSNGDRRIIILFCVVSILFGLIGGFTHSDEFILSVLTIYTIISGIYTRNPIYGSICGFIATTFAFIGWEGTIFITDDDFLWVSFIYCIIGAVSGAIGYVLTKKSRTLKGIEREHLDIYTPIKTLKRLNNDDTLDVYTFTGTASRATALFSSENLIGTLKYCLRNPRAIIRKFLGLPKQWKRARWPLRKKEIVGHIKGDSVTSVANTFLVFRRIML